MRKRILVIFLCLILTLSLAAAVAAEDFTGTLPPGSNFLPPNRPEQPEPDDEDRIVTLQIPIIKIVELGGNTAPKQTAFSFYALPSDQAYGYHESGGSGLWDVQNCTVTVNGAGTFSCVMTIQIDMRDFVFLTDNQGIYIGESDGEQSGWTYDTTRWFLQPHFEWDEAAGEYRWTGGWDCYNKFTVRNGSVSFNRDNAQGGLGFINLYTENAAAAEPAYKPATLNKTDHFAFLKGYPGGGFAPGKNMSRAEVTTMFARLLTEQMETDKSYPNSFF